MMGSSPKTDPVDDTDKRIDRLDWNAIAQQLDESGFARCSGLLEPALCEALVGLYSDASLFRSRVVMARHGFGRGEYQYFGYPLPDLLSRMRAAFYRRLAPLANVWNERLGLTASYPAELTEMLARCHQAGQQKPTALLLKYGAGDFNRLHQDLYGELAFPMQVVFLLSKPPGQADGPQDFSGGEFILTEQRPRMQSRAHVVPLQQGDAVIFAVNDRPVAGTRGWYKTKMRHGVSEVTAGQRFTAGLIFHDAA